VNLDCYKTFVFDCDGVILNSNRLKTEAFRRVAIVYGKSAADALVEYHVANGGVSRYEKFDVFLKQILPACGLNEGVAGRYPTIELLLDDFAEEVFRGLMSCEIAEGLSELRNSFPDSNWIVVSGGAQEELRRVFSERGIANYFDSGIFGSPDSKDVILRRELAKGTIRQPALFFGDSVYDCDAAERAGLEFVFLSGWTEAQGWQNFVLERGVREILSIKSLLAIER
jgi:phosphoglycolate phosphatase-like HAD superfamily hydrolase